MDWIRNADSWFIEQVRKRPNVWGRFVYALAVLFGLALIF